MKLIGKSDEMKFTRRLNNFRQRISEVFPRAGLSFIILIDKYNKEHLGKVRVIPIDFPNFDFSTNERKEILARSLRSRGDGIDLFAVDLIWVQRFAKWCEPLDKYFSAEETGKVLKSALKSCYFEGELVALPLDLVQGVMYYREDLVKKYLSEDELAKIKSGITWKEFIELSERYRPKNPFYIFTAAEYEGLICSYVEFLLSIEPNYFAKRGFNFENESAERALQMMVDLVNKYKISPQIVTRFTEIPSYEFFIKNDALFIRGWQSYDKDFKEIPFDEKKERHLRKAPLPHVKNGQPASTLGGWNLMISRFSNKKKETIDFVKYLISDEAQEIFFRESGYYPVINKFYTDDWYLRKYPEVKLFRNLINTVVHRPQHVNYTRYSQILSHYINSAIRNESTPRDALKAATTAIQNDMVTAREF